MAMTSGVSMNGVGSSGAIGGSPSSASRWLKIVPQLLDAGDQITGRGPSTASSHPSASAVVAAPEDFERTSTNTHSPSIRASSESLNDAASSVSSSIFSELTAVSTVTQSSRRGSAVFSLAVSVSSPMLQAAASSAATDNSTAATVPRRVGRRVRS